MWELYDELIQGIPDDILVEGYNTGCSWALVRAGGSTGISVTVKGLTRDFEHQGPITGEPLKKIAACVKSWNFLEASLGAAAINAYYNAPARVEALEGIIGADKEQSLQCRTKNDAFAAYMEKTKGKRVAVIGHFPNIEEQLGPVCDLSILERNPSMGDYPDTACEYILPQQEFVFITGMTLINKTLSRLLQIVRDKAQVVLVGPSVPLAPVLFDYGVCDLAGFYVTEQETMDARVRRGEMMAIFKEGRMVRLPRA